MKQRDGAALVKAITPGRWLRRNPEDVPRHLTAELAEVGQIYEQRAEVDMGEASSSSFARGLLSAVRADRRVSRSVLEQRLYVAFSAVLVLAGPVPAAYLVARGAVTRLDIALFASFYALTTIGWALGWHRMLAHRAFELRPGAKAMLLGAATMAGQGPAATFVWSHRMHHAHADTAMDPHSPRHGFWHAHAGWFVASGVPEAEVQRIHRDRMVAFFDRFWVAWTVLGFVLPAAIGGLLGGHGTFNLERAFGGFVWGGTLRYVVASHALWLGASLAHVAGHRTFETPDNSRNSIIVSLLTLGEGWHNNHHAAPGAANLDARPWQLDVPALVLRGLDLLGLVQRARWYRRTDWDRRGAQLARRAARAKPRLEGAHPRAARRSERPLSERLAIAAVVGLPFVGGVLAFRRGLIAGTTRLDVALLVVFHLAAYVGMTVGYHRMLCHRAFSPHPIVKTLLLFFGGTAIMATPSEFVAQHLAHHAHSDTERDPHSASRGFWNAHVGWILARDRVNTGTPAWLARDPMSSYSTVPTRSWVRSGSFSQPSSGAHLGRGSTKGGSVSRLSTRSADSCGADSCGSASGSTSSGRARRSITPSADARFPRPMAVATAHSGSTYSSWARASTTTTTPFRGRRLLRPDRGRST
jgi:stearoyl-CoA desaturase (delta-9 desaturase)